MEAYEWLQLLGLGGACGALGQGVRTIVGLKKVHDATANSSTTTSEAMDISRLLTSLAIGFIAGALAAVGLISDLGKVSSEQIFALAAAGYAGADFIEGLVSRVSGSSTLGAGDDAKGVGPAAGGGAAAAGATDDAVG